MSGPWEKYAAPSEDGPWAKYSSSANNVSTGEDVAKSAASGLASATAGTLGAVGDARSLLSSAADWAGNKAGISPETMQTVKNVLSKASQATPWTALMANAPTSRDVINSAPNPIVSPDYQPQTGLGSFVKTGAEFAPGLIDPELAGPNALKAAGRLFATRVAAPAIASETAGQLTDNNPYARSIAALVAGGGASKVERALANRATQAAVPSGEQLLKTGSNQFEQAKNMNVVVKPSFATDTANDVRAALKGYDPEAQGAVFRAIDRLDNLGKPPAQTMTPAQRLQAEMNWEPIPPAIPPQPVSMNDVELVRKQLSALRTSPDASIRSAAKTAQEVLTEKQMALKPSQTLAGDATEYAQTIKDAVGNYGAGKRSNAVTGKIDLANLNAGTAGSGANIDNNTRQALKQLARPMNNTNVPVAKKLGFNDQEIEAIKRAATGTVSGNMARLIGKAAPTGIVSADLSAHAGGAVGGPIGAVALPAAGYIAKKIGDLSTKQAAAALDSLVRSRSPLAREVAAKLPQKTISQLPARTRQLLSGASNLVLSTVQPRLYVSPNSY